MGDVPATRWFAHVGGAVTPGGRAVGDILGDIGVLC